MNVVVILPTYNERENIARVISLLEEEVFPALPHHRMSILVVDDTSPDGTADVVRGLASRRDNIHLLLGPKQGLGAAYLRGMSHAVENLGAEVLFEMDADLSHDPGKIPEFLRMIEQGCDLVVGTRYSHGGSIPANWGIHRKIFSVLGNLVVRLVLMRFSVHDWTGGFRAIRREVFLKEKETLQGFSGYTFQVAFLHKALQNGFRVGEVPIQFTDRSLGKSKIAPLEYIFSLLCYVFSARLREIFKGSRR